ncbi:MAG: hypothetical protein QNJ38_06120 [Prochloraceae cyanobacterium]|nr:hypothetical protein [Prochloraceae cyanobacterium]
MNILLVNSFKQACSRKLQDILDRCYVMIEYSSIKFNNQELGFICGIYTPIDITTELVPYQDRLEEVGKMLNIDWVYVIPIDRTEVGNFLEQARVSNQPEAWKMYLELQYIFSPNN